MIKSSTFSLLLVAFTDLSVQECPSTPIWWHHSHHLICATSFAGEGADLGINACNGKLLHLLTLIF